MVYILIFHGDIKEFSKAWTTPIEKQEMTICFSFAQGSQREEAGQGGKV
jgi:hypothetical protein